VFLVGRRERELETAAEGLAPGASGVVCDVSKLSDLDRQFAVVTGANGRIDVLFQNPGLADSRSA